MKLKKITVGLFLFAGALYVLGGLRDLFAPGFFNISPVVPSTGDIVMKFALALVFLVLAVTFSRIKNWGQKEK